MADILLPSLTRFAAAATGLTGPAHVRERLRLAGAGDLSVDEAKWLGADLDALAQMLAGC